MKRVTIKDVANTAGVSKSTVSHVINQTRFVEDSTRQKVLDAIEELGYRPSSVARSLVSKQTKTAGLLISDIGNPFYIDVIHGVENVALAHGYDIFLCNTDYELDRGLKIIHSLVDKLVDGILFMSSNMSLDLVREAAKHQIPAVVLDWESRKVGEDASTISIQFKPGIQEAAKHLVDLGHKHIAHVSGPLDLWTARKRRDEFLHSLEEFGIDPTDVVVIESNLRIDGGRSAFHKLMQEVPRPTAIFAANDLTALGILWAAREFGLRVPDDLSVIGLDNIELASKVVPPLTTVALPRFEIGNLAMTMLLESIHKREESNNGVFVHEREVTTRLIVRASTAHPSF